MTNRLRIIHQLRDALRRDDGPGVVSLLREHRSEEVAIVLGEVDDHDVERVFLLLNRDDRGFAAEVLSLLDRHDVARVLRRLDDEGAADVLEVMAPDDATWAVELLDDDRVEPVVEAMEEAEKAEVRERLDYPEDSAGRLMSEEFLALRPHDTAGDAVACLQAAAENVTIIYVYLVDDEERLEGVVSLRRLLRVKPDRPLSELTAPEMVTLHVLDDQELVAREFAQSDFVCMPVIDDERRLVGVVTHDDVFDVLREEATEDMLQMAGTTADDVIAESVWGSARVRMPWLLFSLAGGVFAMKVLDLQERRLGELFIALALFVPVIVGMGGNLGTQAATLMVRGLATGRVHKHDALPVFWREIRTASIVGSSYGVLLMLAAFVLLGESLTFCAVVGGSLALSMLMASALGTLLPIAFHSMGVDPAVATGPLVTTTMDVVGIATYLTIAGWLLVG